MRSYTTHERKGSSRASEAAIVYTAPYFEQENYTRLDKFSFFRNGDAEIDAAGVLSVLPTSTTDTDKLAITNNTEVSATVLQNAANFFAEKLQPTMRTLPANTGYKDVAFKDGVFLAITNGTVSATSTDGETWTQRTLPSGITWYDVAAGAGVFVIVGSGAQCATSTNGINWTIRTMPSNIVWAHVFFGEIFVAFSTSGTASATSPDGVTWTSRTLPVSASWRYGAFGNGVYTIAAYGPTIAATSTNGTTWTQRVLPVSSNWITIAFGNNTFSLIASNSTVSLVSSNGVEWLQGVIPSANWDTIAFGGGIFAAIAFHSSIMATSKDGRWWTQQAMPVSLFWDGVVYGTDRFVAISGNSGENAATLLQDPTTRITETPALTLPANHSYFVKIT